ncbi:DUF7344 domain-containing protein [Halorussus sp. AFM4]|uniref:DUF7344 domain-containing protein n=1 Tax=Halorussus sp. AFM4 TaxID=3421651 RepID=UPI003EBC41B4
MTDPSAKLPEAVDESLDVLAHERCRFVLYYFARHSTESVTVDGLTDFICEREQQDGDAARIRTRLHHVTLPRLADVEAVEYDSRSNTARYRGRPTPEAWVNKLAERGVTPDAPV